MFSTALEFNKNKFRKIQKLATFILFYFLLFLTIVNFSILLVVYKSIKGYPKAAECISFFWVTSFGLEMLFQLNYTFLMCGKF